MIVVEVCDRHSAAIDAGSRFHHDALSRSLGAHISYQVTANVIECHGSTLAPGGHSDGLVRSCG